MNAVGTISRDFYTLVRKGIHKNTLVVDILHLDGSVTRERVNEYVFRGFRARRLAMMTNVDAHHLSNRTDRARVGSPSPQDIIIPDFATLCRVHHTQMQYRLMPLLCTDYDTFAGLQAICSSAGSPLRICDRFDPRLLTRRFQQNGAQREQICDFFRSHMSKAEAGLAATECALPIVGVHFDGVLLRHAKMTVYHEHVDCNDNGAAKVANVVGDAASQTATRKMGHSASVSTRYVSVAALVNTRDSLNESTIMKRALLRDYFESPLHSEMRGDSTDLASVILNQTRHRLHCIVVRAAKSKMDAQRREGLVQLARSKDIHIYMKDDDNVYRYVAS